ncbi:hypothetical protein F5Y06DRAFT_267667 [Hypoxylon sp. FL0890]|nr:hypothetical protein F5Y06DRAFT_267667 [Hypoxylon sp. FL0890]
MKTSQKLLLAIIGTSVSNVSAATTCPGSEGSLDQDGISVCCPYPTRWDEADNLYCCVGAVNEGQCGLLDACGHDLGDCDPAVAVTDPDYSSKVFGNLAETTSSVSLSIGGGDLDTVVSTSAVVAAPTNGTGSAPSANASSSSSVASGTTFTDAVLPTVNPGSTTVAASSGVSVSSGASQSVSTGASRSVSASGSGGASTTPTPTRAAGDNASGTGGAGASSSASSTSTSTGDAAVGTQAPFLGLAVGAGIAAAGWYGF